MSFENLEAQSRSEISRRKFGALVLALLTEAACTTRTPSPRNMTVVPARPSPIVPRTPTPETLDYISQFENDRNNTGTLTLTFKPGYFRFKPLVGETRIDPVTKLRIEQVITALPDSDSVRIRTNLGSANNQEFDETHQFVYRYGLGNFLTVMTMWERGEIVRFVINGTEYKLVP